MNEEYELYHRIVDLLKLLECPTEATIVTGNRVHTIYLHPSFNRGYYYVSVINGIENIMRPQKCPMKLERIENFLGEIGIDVRSAQITLEGSKLYKHSPFLEEHISKTQSTNISHIDLDDVPF